jgi:hypothetical protein
MATLADTVVLTVASTPLSRSLRFNTKRCPGNEVLKGGGGKLADNARNLPFLFLFQVRPRNFYDLQRSPIRCVKLGIFGNGVGFGVACLPGGLQSHWDGPDSFAIGAAQPQEE